MAVQLPQEMRGGPTLIGPGMRDTINAVNADQRVTTIHTCEQRFHVFYTCHLFTFIFLEVF